LPITIVQIISRNVRIVFFFKFNHLTVKTGKDRIQNKKSCIDLGYSFLM
jgi:hypothetical protein